MSSGSVARSDEDAEIEAALAGVDEAELAKLAQEVLVKKTVRVCV